MRRQSSASTSAGRPTGSRESACSTRACASSSASGLVVANFEAGLATPFGTDWRAIDDAKGGGSSTATVAIVDGGANHSKKALRATGTVKVANYPFPFAGAGLPLGKVENHVPTPSDLSKHRGIRFWVKGDGTLLLRNYNTTIGTGTKLLPGTTYRLGLHQHRVSDRSIQLEGFVAGAGQPFGAPFSSTASAPVTTTTNITTIRIGVMASTNTLDATVDEAHIDTSFMPTR